MPNIRLAGRITLLNIAALFIALSAPLTPLASAAECVAPSATTPGVHAPTGSDAGTFVYKCDGAYAGKYINDYYIYNPTTNERTPRFDLDYDYNCDTAKWTMTQYYYYPADGGYHAVRVDAGPRPGVATNCPVPVPVAASGGAASATATSGGGSGSGINNTGQGSDNGLNNTTSGNTNLTNNTNASINNVLTGVATSGSATVLNNTVAGSATSGNVQDIANIVNMLQSTSNAFGTDGNVIVFTKDIDGDVNGDLMLDPNQLTNVQNAVSNTGEGSNNNINNSGNNNLAVNNSVDADINNDVNLIARSGDATVANNTRAGDATTGNAKAVANIVNTINSALTAGKSFLGVININGNLNGDILLPANFVDQLIAANVPTVQINTTGANSNNNVNNSNSQNANVTNTNDLGITNNVDAKASTGSANVTKNTNGGSAGTGNATTSITAFNLTGSTVIGNNAILVFVNSHGNWVGLIVNAPAGASAAALGGGLIGNTGANSNNNVNNNTTSNANINNSVRNRINNNVTVNALSGDATVDSNTNAGNARSGNADSAVNLMNVENSSFNLAGWLGILFINVFGTWNGSFGVNTAAGDPIMAQAAAGGSGGNKVSANMQVFGFVPSSAVYSTGNSTPNPDNTSPTSAVLAARSAPPSSNGNSNSASTNNRSRNLWLPALALILFVGFVVTDRLYSRTADKK